MPRCHREAQRRLFEIAEAQQGFFTTKQAKAAGFAENTHSYHVKVGNWIREYRGIYRLALFPMAEHPDLVKWALWSRNRNEAPEGVYSHQTALSLYELSDLNPAKLHMTVPAHFRRNSEIPGLHLYEAPPNHPRLNRSRYHCARFSAAGTEASAPSRACHATGNQAGQAERPGAESLRGSSSAGRLIAMPREYATAKAFRRALEDRLNKTAGAEQIQVNRLRRQVAFDRLLARLFRTDSDPWVNT